MSRLCTRLRLGAAPQFFFITFAVVAAVMLVPSSAEAQSCSAGGAINPLPQGGLSCAGGLRTGDQIDISYLITNTSTTAGGAPVQADLRGVVTAKMACTSSVCTMELPTALSFVPTGGNGCVASVMGVASCAPSGNNEVLVTMTAEGVQLPAGGAVNFVTIKVQADTAVAGPMCGIFSTRADTEGNGIVIDDPACTPGQTGNAGGSSVMFFPECVENEQCSLGAEEHPECNDPICDTGVTGECRTEPREVSTTCERDGDLCSNEHCDGAGECVLESVVQCGPGTNCFSEECNPNSGVCDQINEPVSTACERDGDLCTNEHCDGLGACVVESVVQCGPGTNCFSEECNPNSGVCDQINEPVSTACERDGDLCTNEHCDGEGACVVESEVECTTGACFTEECDSNTGECVRDCDPAANPEECQIIIGDFIWDDDNQDGIQDMGETGIDTVDVNLIECSGAAMFEEGTSTAGGGIYGFTVDAVDNLVDCMPIRRDFFVEVDQSNFLGGGALAGFDGSPRDQGGDDAVDSDCDVITAQTECTTFPPGTTDLTIDCGYFMEPGVLTCRTPGFYGTHGGTEKRNSQNITQALIDEAGFLPVCGGLVIDDTDVDSQSSALEAMCVPVQGEPVLQLTRQLTALSLSCVLSSLGADCSGDPATGVLFAACDTACMGGVDLSTCIHDVDCINNGGRLEPNGSCSLGTCEVTGELCGEDYGSCPPLPELSSFSDSVGQLGEVREEQECINHEGNCHDRDLCPCDMNDDGDCLDEGEDPEGFCFEPPGPAGSSKACKRANNNECTVVFGGCAVP